MLNNKTRCLNAHRVFSIIIRIKTQPFMRLMRCMVRTHRVFSIIIRIKTSMNSTMRLPPMSHRVFSIIIRIKTILFYAELRMYRFLIEYFPL